MRFRLLDRIVELVPGSHVVAEKTLSADEEYLKDHFPLFPVMPGVLMLEAMFQASMWLVQVTQKFESPLVTLKEARNVKYSGFVTPGKSLMVTCHVLKSEGAFTQLKAQGMVGDSTAVAAKLLLERRHVSDVYAGRHMSDAYMRHALRDQLSQLYTFRDSDSELSGRNGSLNPAAGVA